MIFSLLYCSHDSLSPPLPIFTHHEPANQNSSPFLSGTREERGGANQPAKQTCAQRASKPRNEGVGGRGANFFLFFFFIFLTEWQLIFSLSPANHKPCLHRSRPLAGTANQDAGFYMSLSIILLFFPLFHFFFVILSGIFILKS